MPGWCNQGAVWVCERGRERWEEEAPSIPLSSLPSYPPSWLSAVRQASDDQEEIQSHTSLLALPFLCHVFLYPLPPVLDLTQTCPCCPCGELSGWLVVFQTEIIYGILFTALLTCHGTNIFWKHKSSSPISSRSYLSHPWEVAYCTSVCHSNTDNRQTSNHPKYSVTCCDIKICP